VTIAGVLLLALVDSINPSAIVVTLLLLSTAGSRAHVQVPVYVGTFFTTYLLIGVLMVLGLGALLPSVSEEAGFVIQALIGLVLLAYGLTGSRRPDSAPTAARPSAGSYAALVLLGVTVTVMELPTAVPYLGAIALISEAELSARAWVPLLVVYNIIFVLPPLALLAGHLLLKDRLAQSYAALTERLERGARDTAQWIAGLVGGALFLTGVIELVARLR
jgi:cytochrome c biogenesis protein CcdA